VGNRTIFLIFLLTIMVPAEVTLMGQFDLLLSAGLYSTLTGLCLSYVAGNLVANGDGLSLFDVSEPSAPLLLTESQVPEAFWVLVDGRYVYVACDGAGSPGLAGPGLVVLELEGFSPAGVG